DLIKDFRTELKKVPGAKFSFLLEGGPGGNEKPVTYSIRGENIDTIKALAAKIENIVHNTGGTVDVDNSLELSKPEVRLILDREKASDLGVNPYAIASAVRSMVDGNIATKYQEGDEQYDVRVRLRKDDRSDFINISTLNIKSTKKDIHGNNYLIPIGDIAKIEEGTGPSKINRYTRLKEIRVDANISDRFLGEVLGDVQKEIDKIDIPQGYIINVVGQGEEQAESFINMLLSLLLAIVFVYIVLAMQFESLIHPLSIMLSLPMAVVGAALFLLIFGNSVSIISLIGIIMLMGIVTKNAILLVDYTNQLREQGKSRMDALLISGPTRLRPILMTTFSTIGGMLPVAIGVGEGAEW
ncbi:MAG: efflux RND transporter permease subunit, partial [Ignavibacteria bacterium]|nr:efflux RND transporter permease subunit [Ignavibacteria bacterium]